MTIRKNLITLLAISACSLPVERALAVDAVNVITLALTAYNQGETIVRGNATTVKLERTRANHRDIIQAIGDANEMTFSRRAQLLLIRQNFEQTQDDARLVIRDPGQDDFDVSEYLNFSSAGEVETGRSNEANGVYQSLILSIGTFTITIPGQLAFSMSGLTTERGGTIRYDGEQLDGGISSLVARMAGQGTASQGEEAEQAFLLEGTVRLGPTRLVDSPPR